ncbi:MAG: hypothetical protein ACOCZV_00995 [Nanoarchaeota archaeon]
MMISSRIAEISFILCISFLALISVTPLVNAQSIDVDSGVSYSYSLDADFPTGKWAGFTIESNNVPYSASLYSFARMKMDSPTIGSETFPGRNLDDDNHYFVASFSSSFNISKVKNITLSDLEKNALFQENRFSVFYPDYYSYSDTPKRTFTEGHTNISLAGKKFEALKVTLEKDIELYLLKYDDGMWQQPLFLVEFDDKTCFDGTSCKGEFMLPVTDEEYEFFILSKTRSYEYDIWIDGKRTNTFNLTAIPYNLTIKLFDLYTKEPVTDKQLMVAEREGKNIFVPYSLSGIISDAYTLGYVDNTSTESFIVAPTAYPSSSSYRMYVGVYEDEQVISKEELYVDVDSSLVHRSKRFDSPSLSDNIKTSVNSMNQILNSLFKWVNIHQEIKRFRIEYDNQSDQFTTFDYENGLSEPTAISLKTGAPNLIDVVVSGTSNTTTDYSLEVVERDGFLMMNPVRMDSDASSDRYHLLRTDLSTDVIITPSSLHNAPSNVTLSIVDAEGQQVSQLSIPIEDSLTYTGGIAYQDDYLKGIVNSMNQILNNIYYSLNF